MANTKHEFAATVGIAPSPVGVQEPPPIADTMPAPVATVDRREFVRFTRALPCAACLHGRQLSDPGGDRTFSEVFLHRLGRKAVAHAGRI